MMEEYSICNFLASQENTIDADDRISKLPDEVLSHMLTFLNMKEAVRTRLLSHRWRHLCVPVSNLVFDPTFISDVEYQKNLLDFVYCDIFAERVEKCLKTITLQKPLTLKIRFPLPEEFAFSIDEWIRLAVSMECEEIELDFEHSTRDSHGHYFEPYNFPCHNLLLGGKSHLRSLFLRECTFKPPPEVANRLHSLKSLILNNVFVEPSDIEIILSGCSNLELLGLIDCQLLTTLHICGPKLKCLIMRFSNVLDEISLSVPNLEVFEFEGWIPAITLSRLPKLKSAILYIYGSSQNGLNQMLDGLARKAPHLHSLSLKWACDQYISHAYNIKDNPPMFYNLTYLELSIKVNYEWNMLTNILYLSHQLEVLLIDKDYCPHNHDQLSWMDSQPVPECISSCLKKVCFQRFYGQDCELKYAQYILKNARALERMIIVFSGVGCPSGDAMQLLISIINSFPRASEECQVLFF